MTDSPKAQSGIRYCERCGTPGLQGVAMIRFVYGIENDTDKLTLCTDCMGAMRNLIQGFIELYHDSGVPDA